MTVRVYGYTKVRVKYRGRCDFRKGVFGDECRRFTRRSLATDGHLLVCWPPHALVWVPADREMDDRTLDILRTGRQSIWPP